MKDIQPVQTRLHNLPFQLTSFVGREQEIAMLQELLADTRLMTLTGAGGVGKTRLGLELAAQMLEGYRDGVWLVELGSVYEPQLVVHKVSSTLDCRGEGSETRMAALREHLLRKDLLLVLDNCEHLVQVCAEMVAELLHFCPRLSVLTTSREPLGVPGEMVYEVSTLSLPDPDRPGRDEAGGSEAVQLFIERARSFQPGLVVDDSTARAIARICQLLDGIPLAIELAAARVRMMPPVQVAAFLEDSQQFLTTSARTAVSRHQTLQASIEWSHELLSESEQILFRRLAIFAGRFQLEDVQAVCSGSARDGTETDPGTDPDALQASAILDLLYNLVDKSLVRVAKSELASYRLLFPIQRFAWRKLKDSAEMGKLRQRHLGYYRELAVRAQPLIRGAEQSHWLDRIELELDNFRAALDWSLKNGSIEIGLQIAAELGEFWWRQGYSFEGLEWLDRLLDRYPPAEITRADALIQAGRLSREIGNYERANALCGASLELSRELDYAPGTAESMCQLGILAHYYRADLEESIRLLEEGIEIYRKLGDAWNVAIKRLRLAEAIMKSDRWQQATGLFSESLVFFREIGDLWGISFSLGGLGDLARMARDFDSARVYLEESLRLGIESGNKVQIAFVMEAIALVLQEQGDFHCALLLFGYAEALRESIRSLLPPAHQRYYAGHLRQARSAMGTEAFEQAFSEGRGLDIEQAVALAMEPLRCGQVQRPVTGEAPEKALHTASRSGQHGLTARELEVLRLVARGLTDAQVAEELVISPRTVSKHLQSIYGKLQVSSRSAATRFALEQGIA